MKQRIKDIMDSVDENELYKLKADLEKGGVHFKRLVESKIKEVEAKKSGYCITCGKDLGSHNISYSLIFGPDGLRKKAVFCELDCLEYFISELKSMRNYQQRGEEHDLQENHQDVQ